MCYYGSEYPRFIRKDQAHFNLMADLHTVVRNAQQNLYRTKENKKMLVEHLSKLLLNTQKGEYDSPQEESRVVLHDKPQETR